MDNFFSFYNIEELFFIDEVKLKQDYLRLSKAYHPDFYLDDDEKYAEALHVSSINNKAYKQLKTLEGRVAHILRENGLLEVQENKLSQDFLIQMMDINEAIMELKMEPNEQKLEEIGLEVNSFEEELSQTLTSLAQQADKELGNDKARRESIEKIKDIYLKQKYLLRIKESLNTFAAL
jgi:molecular chaperone HscB